MTIYINTNQNVNIEYEISSIGKRIIAYLIDALVLVGVYLVLAFTMSFMSIGSATPLYFVIYALPAFFYHLISELTMNGQSIGKRSVKIRVMKTDGSSASFSNYFLRFLLRPIDMMYFIGLVFMFFTKKGQRLGDLAANTVVVNAMQELAFSDLANSMTTTKEELIYPEVDRLKDKDLDIIKRVLENWQKAPNHENVITLAQKVEDILEVKASEEPYAFLKVVVRDYNTMYA